jgi:4-amino-4-deoxy-L-arabinose transferase-like glycosyltransferase
MAELLKFNPISEKYKLVLLLFLIVLSAFLRLLLVTSVPPGLYQDESAIGYNAYSILQTGKDEYGASYPLYFTSFGDHKLPVYIYLTAASIKLFGLNEFAVRFPSILAGIFAVIIIFLFIQYLTKNITLAFITGLVLALNPANIFFSRAGFEVNVALTFALAGCYFFVLGATKKNIILSLVSLVYFGLSLYSYNVTRLIAPLFLFGLVILYWKQVKSFKVAEKISALVLIVLILIPFLSGFFSSSGVFSATSSLITGADTLAIDLEFRSYLATLPHMYTTLFFNKYIYMIFQYLQNVATLFSGSFFFVSGTAQENQGIGNVGFFYVFDLPFFILGLVVFVKAKIKSYQIFNLWLIASVLVLALSQLVPQATRGYFIILPTVCFIALGIFSFLYYLTTVKRSVLKYILVTFLIVFSFYNIQYFLLSYFFRFPVVYADAWRTEDKELALYLKANGSKYDQIIIDRNTNFIYTTYLFYTAYPPDKFIATEKRDTNDFINKANAWGNVSIRQLNWQQDIKIPHALIITRSDDIPQTAVVFKQIYDPTIYSVLTKNEAILGAPIHKLKYVLIETDHQ